MKTKIIILAFFAVLIIQNSKVTGQEEIPNEEIVKFKNAIGLGAGFTTGYGLSYRYIPKEFGIQINFAPYKNDYTTQISVGLTFLYNVIETEKTSLFIYQANHYLYRKSTYMGFWDSQNIETKSGKFNIGLGIGIEFILLKRISYNLMGGYGAYRDCETLSLTGETGLYFKF
jgi:hypothetical protein